MKPSSKLDRVHHIAVVARDIAESVAWYRDRFHCEVLYQDDTWALLQFENVQLAFVHPEQHPPHVGFEHPRASDFGPLQRHRGGTESLYAADHAGNAVELLQSESRSGSPREDRPLPPSAADR